MTEQTDHIELLTKLKSRLQAASESDVISGDMIHQLDLLIDQHREHRETAWEDSRTWLANLMMMTPQLAPAVDRELLWLMGGECLHYLTDEEMATFED